MAETNEGQVLGNLQVYGATRLSKLAACHDVGP